MSDLYQSPILVKLIVDFPLILEPIKKYINYLQSIINEQTQVAIFIEIIENGLLYIFRDYETFKRLNQPYQPLIENPELIIKSPKSIQNLSSNEIFLLKDVPLKDNFPEHGIKITYTAISEPKAEIIEILTRFFNEIKDSGLILKKEQSDVLIACFNTFSAFVDFMKAIQSLFPNL